MEEHVQSQWVVRLPDRLILLPRPVSAIRVFSTAEAMQFKTYYGSGESKSRIERQYDTNARLEDVKFEYWVIAFPLYATKELPIDVLCCTVQRETAERILDELWMSMFTNCGDNTFVDLRQLLAADLVTPDMVAAATPAAGRFVDLGDGEYRRPVAAVGSVADAAIHVETVPIRTRTRLGGDNGVGLSMGAMLPHTNATTVTAGLLRINDPVAVMNVQIPSVQTAADSLPVIDDVPEPGRTRPADLWIQRPADVPTIGRGLDRDFAMLPRIERERLQAELQAAVQRQEAALHAATLRQRPENRNTVPVPVSSGSALNRNPENGHFTREGIWRPDADRLAPLDGVPSPAATPADTLADRDARRRANPMGEADW